MAKIDLNKMSYQEIEKRYIDYNIQGHYRFVNADEVVAVCGWDFRTIRGYRGLTSSQKEIAERLICNYLNGFGLKSRHTQRPSAIKVEGKKFKLSIKSGGYSYLYLDGTVG